MVKIGNALKAAEDGKWFTDNADVGGFDLKIKPVLPGERYRIIKDLKRLEKDFEAANKMISGFVASKIIDWKGLQDADGGDMPFNAELLKDEKFLMVLFGLTVHEAEGEEAPKSNVVSNWLFSKILSQDAFVEEATESFLAST
jgi:hypothetical protein